MLHAAVTGLVTLGPVAPRRPADHALAEGAVHQAHGQAIAARAAYFTSEASSLLLDNPGTACHRTEAGRNPIGPHAHAYRTGARSWLFVHALAARTALFAAQASALPRHEARPAGSRALRPVLPFGPDTRTRHDWTGTELLGEDAVGVG